MYTAFHRRAFPGLYTAFCVVTGFLLSPVPNIELITLFIFFGGYLFGAAQGGIIGATAYFFYSAFNPWGSGLAFPPLLIAQVTAMFLIGFAGRPAIRRIERVPGSALRTGLYAAAGLSATLVYNILLTFSTYQYSGFSFEQFRVVLVSGIAFSLWHIVSNTLFFPALIPVLIRTSRSLLRDTRPGA